MRASREDDIFDDRLAASFAAGLAPVEPGAQARERMAFGLMARVRAARAGFHTVHARDGEWVGLFPGVELKLLREDAQSRSFLVRMAPGSELPGHAHPADEECLVLEGEVTLSGVLCRAGDYQLAPAGRDHDVVRSEPGCLLFVRAWRDPRLPIGARS